MAIRRLAYVSCPDPRLSPDEIGRIAMRARANNAVHGITGVLLYTGRDFAQLIEGEPDAVDLLWRNLAVDHRHGDIAIVFDATDDSGRWFKDWRMGYVYDPRSVDTIGRWRTRMRPFSIADVEHLRAIFLRADTL